MKKQRVVRGIPVEEGSGNVYTDLGYSDSESMLVKARLAAKIAEILRPKNIKNSGCGRALSPPRLLTARATIMVVRLVEAQYENGVLRPAERLGLRSGERVSLMVVRRPDPRRWDLARLAGTANREDVSLSEQGLAEWTDSLDAAERS